MKTKQQNICIATQLKKVDGEYSDIEPLFDLVEDERVEKFKNSICEFFVDDFLTYIATQNENLNNGVKKWNLAIIK